MDLLRFSSSLSVPTAKHKNAMKKRDTKHSKAKQSSRAEAHQDTRLKEELLKPSGLREHPPAHLYARTQLRQTADEHSQQLAPPPSNASSGDAACIFSVVAHSVPVLPQVTESAKQLEVRYYCLQSIMGGFRRGGSCTA